MRLLLLTSKLVAFAFGILLLASTVSAQGPQVQWTQSNVQSATQAQGFTYKVYITPPGQGVLAPITLANVLCGSTVPNVQCATALPSSANQALISGAKTELTATDPSNGTESAKSTPFFITAAAPISLRIIP